MNTLNSEALIAAVKQAGIDCRDHIVTHPGHNGSARHLHDLAERLYKPGKVIKVNERYLYPYQGPYFSELCVYGFLFVDIVDITEADS